MSDTNYGQKLQNFVKTIPDLFEKTVFYKILDFNTKTYAKNINIFELYLNDFILVNCDVKLELEVRLIKKAIMSALNKTRKYGVEFEEKDYKFSFPLLHFEYENLKNKIDTYLKFSNFEPDINKNLDQNTDFNTIDFDSCLVSIDLYQRQSQKSSNTMENSHRTLENHLRMIRYAINVLNSPSDMAKYNKILAKYKSFKLLHLFLEDVCLKQESLTPVYPDMINALKFRILKEAIDFKSKAGIDYIHDFITLCIRQARKFLFEQSIVSKCCKRECVSYKKLYSTCGCLVCSDCEIIIKSRIVNSKIYCLSCNKESSVNVYNNQISIYVTEIPYV